MYIKDKFFQFCFFCKLTELTKTDEYMKRYFPAILWIPFDQIIVQAPSIPHFKGLGMRNLEYEIRICKKLILKSQCQCQCCPSFFETDFITKGSLIYEGVSSIIGKLVISRSLSFANVKKIPFNMEMFLTLGYLPVMFIS